MTRREIYLFSKLHVSLFYIVQNLHYRISVSSKYIITKKHTHTHKKQKKNHLQFQVNYMQSLLDMGTWFLFRKAQDSDPTGPCIRLLFESDALFFFGLSLSQPFCNYFFLCTALKQKNSTLFQQNFSDERGWPPCPLDPHMPTKGNDHLILRGLSVFVRSEYLFSKLYIKNEKVKI